MARTQALDSTDPLLFHHREHQTPVDVLPLDYDEETDVNYVTIDGARVPAIEACSPERTSTITKVVNEDSDYD